MLPRCRTSFLLLASVVVSETLFRFDGCDTSIVGYPHLGTFLVSAAAVANAEESTPDTDKDAVERPSSSKSSRQAGNMCDGVASATESSISAPHTATSLIDLMLQRFLLLGRTTSTVRKDFDSTEDTAKFPDRRREQQRQQHRHSEGKLGRPKATHPSFQREAVFGLPSSQSEASSSSNGDLYNFHYRFAQACTGEDECQNQQEHYGKDFNVMATSSRHIDAFPGMVLQILERNEGVSSLRDFKGNDDEYNQNGIGVWLQISDQESLHDDGIDNFHDEGDTKGQCDIYGYGPGADSSSFVFERAYALEEPLQLELGVVPKHYADFAYTPVMTRERQEAVLDDTADVEEECLDGNVDCSSTQTKHHYTRDSSGDNSNHINLNDQNAATAVHNENTQGSHQKKDASVVQILGPSTEVLAPSNTDHASSFSSWWSWWFPLTSSWWRPHGSTKMDYDMGKTAFAGGSNGEVWRGRRICAKPTFLNRQKRDLDCDDKQPLVLKRLRVERGYRLLEAGLREVYFGNLIRKQIEEESQDFFTVYVDHFFREVPRAFGRVQAKDLELWIVFEDAGPSLRSYMYTASVSGGFMMYQQSKLWTQLRTFSQKVSHHDEEDTSLAILDENSSTARKIDITSNGNRKSKISLIGRNIMRDLLHQILSAAAALHEKGIVHRDIKPSNVMCKTDIPVDDLHLLKKAPHIHCRLGDLSSGWDPYTAGHLYTNGPSPGEQTDEYAPPESFVGPNWVAFDKNKPQSYDSWSIGVTALELLLGSPNVFSVDQRTNALLTNKMKRAGASDEEISHALYLAALSNFCIYVPSKNPAKTQSWPLRYGDPLHKTAMVKESCTLQDFHRALTARDPLGLGFSGNDLLLHLIWQLLAWDPNERMTAEEALHHPYFTSPDGTLESVNLIAGSHNALESQMLDPRMDFTIEDDVESFVCPKCGRTFHDWKSCQQHSNHRKHAKFCTYDRRNLPSCINAHSMLPAHPTSGYCDLQGRRATIEDFHSIHLHPDHQFYGIFDGHAGNLASKFVAGALYETLISYLPNMNHVHDQQFSEESPQGKATLAAWKDNIRHNITKAFEELHRRFLDTLSTMPVAPFVGIDSAPNMDQSGTTATVLLVTESAIVVAGLGDSRAVMSSCKEVTISKAGSEWSDFPPISAVQLTVDHIAADPAELALVMERGGSVSTKEGGLPRVNGTLAITRSIGDANLSPVLSREPSVLSLEHKELRDWCGSLGTDWDGWKDSDATGDVSQIPCFVVLASDGLWDVVSNQEAVDMVVDVILQERIMIFNDTSLSGHSTGSGGVFQEAAERLALEAYVRGSTDNIGVCVVAVN